MAQVVTPLPVNGDVILGRDTAGRVLRISRHAALDRVVLSIWDGGRCMGTVRLASADVPELVRTLVGTLVDDGAAPRTSGRADWTGGRADAGTLRLAQRGRALDTAREFADRVKHHVRQRLTGGRQ